MEILEWVNDHPDFSGNQVARNWTPSARIGTVVAIVSHNKVFIFGKSAANIDLGTNIDVWFSQQDSVRVGFVVDMNLTITNFHGFTR